MRFCEKTTYQLLIHISSLPLSLHGPQQPEQQRVTHPLRAVMATVAVPATVKTQREKHRARLTEQFTNDIQDDFTTPLMNLLSVNINIWVTVRWNGYGYQ